MIPHPHRMKGGAPQLGTRYPGEAGPFGPYDDVQDDDHDDPDGTKASEDFKASIDALAPQDKAAEGTPQ